MVSLQVSTSNAAAYFTAPSQTVFERLEDRGELARLVRDDGNVKAFNYVKQFTGGELPTASYDR